MNDLIFGKVVHINTIPSLMAGKAPKKAVDVCLEGFISVFRIENYLGRLEIKDTGEKVAIFLNRTNSIPEIGDITISHRNKKLGNWLIVDKLTRKRLGNDLYVEFDEHNRLRITLMVW